MVCMWHICTSCNCAQITEIYLYTWCGLELMGDGLSNVIVLLKMDHSSDIPNILDNSNGIKNSQITKYVYAWYTQTNTQELINESIIYKAVQQGLSSTNDQSQCLSNIECDKSSITIVVHSLGPYKLYNQLINYYILPLNEVCIGSIEISWFFNTVTSRSGLSSARDGNWYTWYAIWPTSGNSASTTSCTVMPGVACN